MTYPNPSNSVTQPDGTPVLPGDIFAVTIPGSTGASKLPTRTRPAIEPILKQRVKTNDPWVDFATGFIGELFSGFSNLFQVADSIVAILTGGVIGGPIGGQSWVATLSDWIGGFSGTLGGLQSFVKNIIDTIMNGLGFFGSGFGLGALLDAIFGNKQSTDQTKTGLDNLLTKLISDPVSVLGSIPQTLVSGLVGALNLKAPLSMVQDLINGIAQAIRGIPFVGATIADVITALTGVKDSANTSMNTGSVASVKVIRRIFTSNTTWNPSAIPSGYTTRTKTVVLCIGGGSAGLNGAVFRLTADRVIAGISPPQGGRDGGYMIKSFTPAEIPASIALTIGVGGAKLGGNGNDGKWGNVGTVSKFGNLHQSVPGASAVPTDWGALPSSSAPTPGSAIGGWNASRLGSSNSGAFFGGINVNQNAGASAPTAGQSVLAASGTASGGSGGNGPAPATDPSIYHGGVGGGYGGTAIHTGSSGVVDPGIGGDGAFPGGGGGNGGDTVCFEPTTNTNLTAYYAPAGSGANGAIVTWEYFQ